MEAAIEVHDRDELIFTEEELVYGLAIPETIASGQRARLAETMDVIVMLTATALNGLLLQERRSLRVERLLFRRPTRSETIRPSASPRAVPLGP